MKLASFEGENKIKKEEYMSVCVVCEEVEVEEEGEKCESCEELSFFVGEGSLLHPDETEEEFWDHED